MEEAILQLRAGDGMTELVGIIALVAFLNWYDSWISAKAFDAIPLPHQDPVGWYSGKYDHRKFGPHGYSSSSMPSASIWIEKILSGIMMASIKEEQNVVVIL